MILDDLKRGNNSPQKGEFIFNSSDHIRYQNGVDITGHNYGCNRAVKIESNISGGNGYSVTIFNLDAIHPVWGNNIQMATKPMEIIEYTNTYVKLRSYGRDMMGSSFADYGITVYFVANQIIKITLHMFDRGIDLEYLK